MKQYIIEPITYTNDYDTKVINCKRLNPAKIVHEAYGLSMDECISMKPYCIIRAGYCTFKISSFS